MNTPINNRFPNNTTIGGNDNKANPAIQLYGRRFYKDQTSVEYLAEFLLVFSSPKCISGDGDFEFKICTEPDSKPSYYPKDHVALKLFSFFSTSKLETRHLVHRKAYQDALDQLGSNIVTNNDDENKETIQLLQNLLNGFIALPSNRTWVTHSFLPVSESLLSREVDWLHGKAKKESVDNWMDAKKYFVYDLHNFMARGGEVLFLQLANLFSNIENSKILDLLSNPSYKHIKPYVKNIEKNVRDGLTNILKNKVESLDSLVSFIDKTLSNYNIKDQKNTYKVATLGWVPSSTIEEALFFAVEISNICNSNLGNLDKLEQLQVLCSMHVLRTHCFQSRRFDQSESKTNHFIGNYAWIVADGNAGTSEPIRKAAQHSFEKMEALLYRALRHKDLNKPNKYSEADKHGYQIFRKISKEIGFVIPLKGANQRFSLNQELLRFFVIALVKPGESIRLSDFYKRIFSHYGIAIGGDQLMEALRWIGSKAEKDTYAALSNNTWVEDALKQGGFLIELSDAVSIVKNPSIEMKGQ